MNDELTETEKRVIEDKEWVTQDSDARDEIMTIRAVTQEDGVCGTITDVYVKDEFVAEGFGSGRRLGRRIYEPKKFGPRNSRLSARSQYNGVDSYPCAIQYSPKVLFELEFETGEVRYIESDHLEEWNPSENIFYTLYELQGSNLTALKNGEIPITYNPLTENSGEISIQTSMYGTVTQQRNMREKEDVHQFDQYGSVSESCIEPWFDYLRCVSENPTQWVQSRVTNVLSDEDTFTLTIPTPTGVSVFNTSIAKNSDSPFWNIVETLGGGDPAQIKNEQVYIRLHKESMYDDMHSFGTKNSSEYTVLVDVEDEWELAITNPNDRTVRERVRKSQAVRAVQLLVESVRL